MTDRRREEQIHPSRSAYMHYIHTTEMARRHERQLAQLDEEICRNEAMMLKRQRDSRMKTENAIRELRLEQKRRLIKEKQRLQEHEARRRARRQNREQLERELERIKNELRAELTKEDVKCQKTEEDESEQHEEEESEQHEEKSEQHEEEESEQHEEERKMLTFIRQKEVNLKHAEGRQPEAELKTKEHKQRHKDKQSTATGQEYERIQDETEEEEQRKDTTCMVNDVTSDEKRETEVQTGYRKKTHEDSMISDDTPQQDCTCNSIPYDPLNISCAQITTLEVPHNSDRQEAPVDETHRVCIAQESLSDDPIQSDSAHASLSDEKLQISRTKITNLKVHHVANLQRETMQHAESRNIVMTCKNCSLCFKFLWWQDGLLMS